MESTDNFLARRTSLIRCVELQKSSRTEDRKTTSRLVSAAPGGEDGPAARLSRTAEEGVKETEPRVPRVLLEFCTSHFTQCSRSTNKYECVAQESPGTSRLPNNSPFYVMAPSICTHPRQKEVS